MHIQNNVVVITGASSGFGEAIARRCAQGGASVVLAARTGERLDALVAELGPQRTLAVPTDVTSDADVDRLRRLTLERFGRVDVLVNNAGFGTIDRFSDMNLAHLQAMMDVNLYGAVSCTYAFLPHMLARRSGQIVMMASLAGLVATQNMSFYSATKFALVGLSRSLMLELAGSGVRCALICPGVALTGFQQHAPVSKYARNTRLIPQITAELVADRVVRAIARRTHGEVLVPRVARPLTAIAGAFPGLTRFVLRVIG